MHNNANPKVPIDLDRPRHLLLSYEALALLEDELKINFLTDIAALTEVFQSLTLRRLFLVLWAMLKHEDESLELKQVGYLIPFGKIGDCQDKILEAFHLAVATTGEKSEGAEVPPPAAGPPGSTSGVSPGTTSG